MSIDEGASVKSGQTRGRERTKSVIHAVYVFQGGYYSMCIISHQVNNSTLLMSWLLHAAVVLCGGC